MYGYIYETTNKIDGKKYIGLHRYNIKEIDVNYLGSGVLLTKAIKKYGWENFSCEIIDTAETKKELAEKEAYWIEKTNAINDENYYNLNVGGYGGWEYINENRLAPSANGNHPLKGKTGENAVRYGAEITAFTRDLISKANKGRRKITNGISNKQVKCEELIYYLNLGWYFGECNTQNKKHTDEWKSNHSKCISGTIKITNGTINKSVRSEADIPDGWWKGEIHKPKSKEDSKKQKESASKRIKGTRYMNNGKEMNRVPQEKIEEYLNNGWVFGMIKFK